MPVSLTITYVILTTTMIPSEYMNTQPTVRCKGRTMRVNPRAAGARRKSRLSGGRPEQKKITFGFTVSKKKIPYGRKATPPRASPPRRLERPSGGRVPSWAAPLGL